DIVEFDAAELATDGILRNHNTRARAQPADSLRHSRTADAAVAENTSMCSHRAWFLLAATLAVSASGCGPSDGVTIQGCGATFPAPLYQRWFLEYYLAHPDVRINYQAIGSGAGIQQFTEGLVSFGASDEALKESKLQEIAKKLSEREGRPVEVIQVPLTGGSVAICYNLPDSPPLKLTRKTYVDMLLGDITHWDDPQIQATNPEVRLPHL